MVLYISERPVISNGSWVMYLFMCILIELRLDYGCPQKRKLLKIKKDSKLRLSSYKLATATGKWYNIEKQKQTCNLCLGSAAENEIDLLLDYPVYKDL